MKFEEAIESISLDGKIMDNSMICIFKKKIDGQLLIFENPITKDRKGILIFKNEKSPKLPDLIDLYDFSNFTKKYEPDYDHLPD